MSSETHRAYYNSPVGLIEITGSKLGIQSILFRDGIETNVPDSLVGCVTQLDEYFKGKRKSFHIKLNPQGSNFQMNVWSALLAIPYGSTCTYLEIAKSISNEQAVRAVGHANGKNKINIIVPCHRVIGSDGTLTGYGGELWRKKWLLDFEKGEQQTTLFNSNTQYKESF